jgi:hypothetical protein
MNDQVAAYRGLVDSLAQQLARSTRARRVGAEYDDLFQEGMIAVWWTLKQKIAPSAEYIENRMRDWIRQLAHQVRLTARPCGYESGVRVEVDPVTGEAIGPCEPVVYDEVTGEAFTGDLSDGEG